MVEREFNFVVVGSGAAGLVGAITASLNGLRPIVIEKAECWGGTTATSGGVLWVPCNDTMDAEGAPDSPAAARRYVHALLGEDADERRTAKADAFLGNAAQMARMLEEQGMRWLRSSDHPDYYPEMPGNGIGRTIESRRFDGRLLKAHYDTMRGHELDLPAISSDQFGPLTRAYTSLPLLLDAARTAGMHKLRRLIGQKPLGNGRALAAALRRIAMDLEIPVRLGTRLVDLLVENGTVTGVAIEDRGQRERLEAPAGVLLAAGGFSRSKALRKSLQGRDAIWPNAIPEDEGDALHIATRHGAATALTDGNWWMPTIQVTPERNGLALGLRALPGSIIVNASGRRYLNEARSYMDVGRRMYEAGAADERHWLIMDGRFLKRYIFAELSDKGLRAQMLRHGYLRKADTLDDLARACGFDPKVLQETVERFNGFARTGQDLDFGRGETSYERHWADPAHKPNPSLGEIRKGPFWAAVLRPGDLGSNGGLKTDALARVLDEADMPLTGLYAAGNGSESPFGHTYPGAGATIASAATFGFIAARDAARRQNRQIG